jgi:hypothetical protein
MQEQDRKEQSAKNILKEFGAEYSSIDVTENADGSLDLFVITVLGNGYDVHVSVRNPSF